MRSMFVSAAAVAAFGLSGCVTSGGPAPDRPLAGFDYDAERIAQVEREAKRRGIGVYWVHPPRQKDPPPRY